MEERLSSLDRAFADEGLDFLGVASVDASSEVERDRYRQFLSEGKHGTMTFLERHEPGKYDPGFSLEGCRSVIVAGLGYFQARRDLPAGSGLVARYAWGRDYHKVFLAKLKRVAERLALAHPEERWRTFTDTAPLDERYWAQRAGASFTARNTLAINRSLGSWFLIGEILTTRVFEATGPAPHRHGSCPSGCRRCHDVCPTGALDTEGRIDARLCISYLTIEHKGPIDDALKPGIGAWLFGCDLCQEVCPFNLTAKPTRESEFVAWKAGPDLRLEEILALEPESFTARFGGSPVHRAGRNGLVRNACLVAANTGAAALLPRLETLTADQDAGVADAARWAVSRLRSAS
jgi:epoxyqueuosine reductase